MYSPGFIKVRRPKSEDRRKVNSINIYLLLLLFKQYSISKRENIF
jgi:hypothetical protein